LIGSYKQNGIKSKTDARENSIILRALSGNHEKPPDVVHAADFANLQKIQGLGAIEKPLGLSRV
jgi:hypothetical protein